MEREVRQIFKPLLKKNKTLSATPLVNSNLDLENVAMDNFCRAHMANHLKKSCP
jgi:hypothetical protein